MGGPTHQHFIPKSYLKNFAESLQEGKNFVFVKRGNEEPKEMSIRDICVKKNLYTLPNNISSENKFIIEQFYAETLDSKFPEIIKILTDDTVFEIDFDTRLKIINSALGLYFRTPKFLDRENKLFEQLVNFAKENSTVDKINIEIFGEVLTFNKDEAQTIIKEKSKNNRILFLSKHLRAYEKLVNSKLKDGICVYKIIDDSEFITCDNPVVINPFADPTKPNFIYEDTILKDPFCPENFIQLPLNKKYILVIMPKSAGSNLFMIDRAKIKGIDVLIYNKYTQKNSENLIIGSELGLNNHLKDQINYNDATPENIQSFEDYENKAILMKEFVELWQNFFYQRANLINKIRELRRNPIINDDISFLELIKKAEDILGISS